MNSYYSNLVGKFLDEPTNTIIGALTTGASKAGFYQQQHTQTDAWQLEINQLKQTLAQIPESEHWYILLEYSIPRRAKRVDTIILTNNLIFVIEFKVGSKSFLQSDIAQAEDYALDLRDFHLQSRINPLIPILVSTDKAEIDIKRKFYADEFQVKQTVLTNSRFLGQEILYAIKTYGDPFLPTIDYLDWENSDYKPTPTIIEAAQVLYAGKSVEEISRSHAGVENLTTTTKAVINAVNSAKTNSSKLICFITGVPGAGKTLAGLNIVHNDALHESDLGVFLSGNGPLVKVLSEALARDSSSRSNMNKKEARRKVSTFIQNVHHFFSSYFDNEKIPIDRVVIFDEAQRAWDAEQSRRKFGRDFSEPEMMLQIMDRHSDWAVIVALIGGGQEINSGEAGLSEWGRTLQEKFPHWKIQISPQLITGHHSTAGSTLFDSIPSNIEIIEDDALHLSVSLRAFRAERLSDFVTHLLDIDKSTCREIIDNDLQDYPILFTRDLNVAKQWLKSKQRGSRRIGIIASSGARRIKPYGFNVQQNLDVESWFLNPPDDVRSSYYLEDVATEFGIQGLELDWTCICWGADFRYSNNRWLYRRFRGTKWENVNARQTQEYIKNKYRVLLTRAREGLIIWIPPGDEQDKTRLPKIYESTALYLAECGIQELRSNS